MMPGLKGRAPQAQAAVAAAPRPVEGRSQAAWRSIIGVVTLLWRSCPRHLVAIAALAVVVSLLPLVTAQLGKMVVDSTVAAMSGSHGRLAARALWALAVLITVEFTAQAALVALERLQGTLRSLAGIRVQTQSNLQILQKAIGLTLVDFERPQFYDLLSRAKREAPTRPMSLVQRLVLGARQSLTLIGYTVLLAGFSGWLVLVLVAGILPVVIRESWSSEREYRMRRARTGRARQLSYLEHVLTTDTHVKEVKLFGLGSTFLQQYQDLARSIDEEERAAARSRVVWGTLISLANTAGFYLCYAWIIFGAVRGLMTIGEMTMYLFVCRHAQLSLFELTTALGGLYDDALYASNLLEFLALPAPEGRRRQPGPVQVRSEQGVRLQGVGFRYPGAEQWAVRDLDLFLPRGQMLGVVGGSGAGKTTFLKLICGLYEPTEGRILLDGRDLADWDPAKLSERIAAVLQDFNRYQLTLKENICLGNLAAAQDAERLRGAVCSAGLEALASRLPLGLETQLGHWFDRGVELSGGEWQRVSLARAFMRAEADVLLLDEPTAALDAEMEHAVYQSVRKLSAGRTAVIISHRLANVRGAHAILVLDRGRAVQYGRHDQLMADQGRYERLFTLQAEGYR